MFSNMENDEISKYVTFRYFDKFADQTVNGVRQYLHFAGLSP